MTILKGRPQMAQKSQPSNGKWVVLAIVAAIATALLVAVVVGGGDEGSGTTNSLPGGDVLAQENQPVVIEGTALEPLGDEAIAMWAPMRQEDNHVRLTVTRSHRYT